MVGKYLPIKMFGRTTSALNRLPNSLFVRFASRRTIDEIKLPLFARALEPESAKKIAFTDYKGDNFTYEEFGKKSAYLAKELKSLVPGQEERIAFLCDRDFSFPTTLGATWWAQHVAIPLSSTHPENMLEYFVKSTSSKLIVTNKKYADRLNKVAKATGAEMLVVDYETLKSEDNPSPSLLDSKNYEDKNALILFTSGTTGMPKGVLLTHSNLLAQVENICDAWEVSNRDSMLHVLPLHHTHGLIHALISPVAVGARCHMLEKFDAVKAWQELLSSKEMRPNVLMAVPTVYVKLIEEYEKSFAKSSTQVSFVRETLKQKMRLILSGSAALPVPVLEKFKVISGHTCLERYGMTEIGMALTNPLHGERKPGFVGGPFETVQLMVADMRTRSDYTVIAVGDAKKMDVKVSKGEKVIGDLLVKGPSVFKEYWGNPDATKKEFTDDGWFITGDTVEYLDGSFKILGRKSIDIIKSGGYKLSALEIETQLLSLPEVKEVAVLGIPDPTWGQKVAAVVAWRGKELTANELRDLAKTRLPAYACPTVLKSLPELPKNHLGKVNKKELAKIFS
ncbi:Acyl-CoA synthetase family member 3, mitochondrial [Orchesella cincta]|uniref:Acyl-CoA synthetase family member 3, mitochondrial n=1 Tax=Orchesella cincta TaxID=48709 RepID=A0A1D2MTB6_ORCCI|nr:Acyl-CoA synthetase family member 3, mitochondrial [Orchesella cincta]